MLGEQPVEQRGVPILERRQPDVPLQGIGLHPQMLQLEGDLLLDREDAVREQAAQAEGVALPVRESEVLRQQAVAEQGRSGERDRRRPTCRDRVERSLQGSHRPRVYGRSELAGMAGPRSVHSLVHGGLRIRGQLRRACHEVRGQVRCGPRRPAAMVRLARRGRRQPKPTRRVIAGSGSRDCRHHAARMGWLAWPVPPQGGAGRPEAAAMRPACRS